MTKTRISLVLALVIGVLPVLAAAQAADPLFLEAKRLYDSLDYENAVRALDQSITLLLSGPQDKDRRALLVSAYEMRARSKFGLGDQDGAAADFTALLKLNPSYTLTGDVSPRVVALFESIVAKTVTTLQLSVTPDTATVQLDGVPVAAGSVPIAVGDHVITAARPGYRSVQQTVTATTGTPAALTLSLERVASIVRISTVPADVDVTIDGVKRGTTSAGTPAASAGPAPAGPGGAALEVNDLQPGAHLIELTRDCYVPAQQRLTIAQPDDFNVGPVELQHAVASLSVAGPDIGAQVFVDGQPRGAVPFTMPDLCAGDHTVEIRSAAGRYVKQVTAKTGDRIEVEGAVKPAFALVSSTGQPAGGPDARLLVERALDASKGTALFAPPEAAAEQALRANQLPEGWLAFDANGRPMGAAADIVQRTRQDASTKLSTQFASQGVGAVTVVARNQAVLSLLASGSGEPDVVDVSLDDPPSIAAAVARLDRLPDFSKLSIGLTTIDVADLPGPVVLRSDGQAAAAGVNPGDVVVQANGKPVADSEALNAVLDASKAGETITLDVQGQAGANRSVKMQVRTTPRLIGISDQTLLANRIILALRARLLGTPDPAEEPTLRLNLAAALMHVENWNDARTELARVQLPDGSGVAGGTVQYLLGVCDQKLGNVQDAEAAFRAAAQSDALLTEDGPAVKTLASAQLNALQHPAGTP